MNVDLPLHEFTQLLFLMAREEGNLSIEEAMESGLLDQYVKAYKAGEITLPDEQEIFEDYLAEDDD